MSDEKKPESESLFGSFLGGDASQRAWGFWESVKTNPRLQQAQQQAQEAWKSYDKEKVKQRLAELGKSATTYIDEADRRLETLELGAMNYLQQRGSELVDKVKETAVGPEMEGEVLFTGPERTPISRLDSEIMSLNASPDRILDAEPESSADTKGPDAAVCKEWLSKSAELEETFKTLVPAKLSEEEFWRRYSALRSGLELHDQRRKQLIHAQGKTDNEDFDDWGSSDEEDKPNASSSLNTEAKSGAKPSTEAKPNSEAKASSKAKKEADKTGSTEPKQQEPKQSSRSNKSKQARGASSETSETAQADKSQDKRIEDEGSDSDWE